MGVYRGKMGLVEMWKIESGVNSEEPMWLIFPKGSRVRVKKFNKLSSCL